MKRVSIFFLLLAAAMAQAQNQPGTTLSANNQCATINTTGIGAVGITVAGTFSGTLTPQVIIAGQTAANTKITLVTDASKAATVTSAGTYVKSVGGYDQFQMCFTSYASGSAIIYFKPTPIINADDLSGGSSSSGTVNANNGSAGAVATYAAASGSTTVGPDAGMTSTGTGGLTLGAAGVGTGALTAAGTTSGTVIWQCNAGACTSWTTGSPVQSTSNTGFSMKHLNQIAASNFAGTCTLVSGTCTVTLNLTYTTPLCAAFRVSGTLTGILTATLSATTLTISSSVGADTAAVWGFCMGNPT